MFRKFHGHDFPHYRDIFSPIYDFGKRFMDCTWFLPFLFRLIGGHFTPQASMCSDLNLEHTGEDHGVSSGRGGGGGLSVPDAASPCSVTKTLLAKLTIRKPSILSITSNLSSPGATQANVGDNFGGSLTDIHDIKRKFTLLHQNGDPELNFMRQHFPLFIVLYTGTGSPPRTPSCSYLCISQPNWLKFGIQAHFFKMYGHTKFQLSISRIFKAMKLLVEIT